MSEAWAAAEAIVLMSAGGTLVFLAGRALVVHQDCRPPTAVALGVAGLCAFLWGAPTVMPGATAWPTQAFRLLFFGIVGIAVFLYTAELGRLQAKRLERSLDRERAKARALIERDHQVRALLRSGDVGLVAVGPDGKVLRAEGRALERAGMAVPTGTHIQDLFKRHRRALGLFGKAMAGQEAHGLVGLRKRVLETTWLPMRGMGAPVLMLAIDVTGRIREERHARRAFRQRMEIAGLRDQAAFRSRLLNTASHELNTPITPLMLHLHVLRQTMGSDERQVRAVGVLDRNVRRLADLVRDVLDVARMESDGLALNPMSVGLVDVVEDIVETYGPQAAEKGVRLETDVTDGLHAHVDDARIHQVLANLVTNALRFTPSGGMVRLAAHADGGKVMVEVRDTGIGLEPDQIGRLFQPFTQVHDPLAHDVGGTGLGLYIARGIVRASGGELGVDSDGRGQGSVFWCTWPRDAVLPDQLP